ncbi:MAG: hypothetical protein U1A27_03585 [Phycisphaerae bacterium]
MAFRAMGVAGAFAATAMFLHAGPSAVRAQFVDPDPGTSEQCREPYDNFICVHWNNRGCEALWKASSPYDSVMWHCENYSVIENQEIYWGNHSSDRSGVDVKVLWDVCARRHPCHWRLPPGVSSPDPTALATSQPQGAGVPPYPCVSNELVVETVAQARWVDEPKDCAPIIWAQIP